MTSRHPRSWIGLAKKHEAPKVYEVTSSAIHTRVVGWVPPPPYPWCIGNPTKADCAWRGYCTRNPACDE